MLLLGSSIKKHFVFITAFEGNPSFVFQEEKGNFLMQVNESEDTAQLGNQ